ncbi:MAG: hypothetical protein R6W71_09800, partial [Bacteroidales bacterium]
QGAGQIRRSDDAPVNPGPHDEAVEAALDALELGAQALDLEGGQIRPSSSTAITSGQARKIILNRLI